jgi:putative peptide zinc metalloprotease protein
LIKRHIFRIKSQQPLPTVSQRIWLFIYGILSGIYRVFVGIVIILIVGFQVPILGWLMAIGGVVTWVFVPIGKLIKYLALEPELHRKRPRAVAFTVAVTATVVILIGFIPWWVRVEATGILEPEQRAVMHARAGGFVTRIVHRDGDWVKKDDILIVCDDPELDSQIAQAQAQVRGVQAQADKDRVSNVAQWKEDLQELDVYNETLTKLTKQKNDLTVRAPFDGELIAPELRDWPGRYVEKGQELFTVATMDKLLVRVALEQQDAQLASQTMDKQGNLQLEYGAPEIRVAGDLEHTVLGTDPRIVGLSAQQYVPSPALTNMGGGDIANDPTDPKGNKPAEEQFELQVKLANPRNPDATDHREYLYVSGQRAYVRLTVERKPLAWQWYRKFLQLIESREKTASKLV